VQQHTSFFLLTSVTYGLLVSSFGQLLGNISPHPGIAFMAFGLVIVLMTLTAGFLIPKNQMPGWFSWFYYLSFTHYYLEAVLVNEMLNQNFTCPNNNGAVPVTFVSGETNASITQWFCPIQQGKDLLKIFDFDINMMWPNIAILFGCYLAIVLLGAIALRLINFQKR